MPPLRECQQANTRFARLGSQGSDAAKAVGVSPTGSEVFVAGSVQVRQLGFTDIETAAYTP